MTDHGKAPEPRVRFNRGYHAGADAAERRRPYLYTHFDRHYLAGWHAGHQDAFEGLYADDSTAAWTHYLEHRPRRHPVTS